MDIAKKKEGSGSIDAGPEKGKKGNDGYRHPIGGEKKKRGKGGISNISAKQKRRKGDTDVDYRLIPRRQEDFVRQRKNSTVPRRSNPKRKKEKAHVHRFVNRKKKNEAELPAFLGALSRKKRKGEKDGRIGSQPEEGKGGGVTKSATIFASS